MDSFFRDNEVHTDSLTEAYTQDTLRSYASYLIRNEISFSFASLDLDNFTYIKDSFGTDIANKVLYDVAHEIRAIIGNVGVLARGNSDEFSMIFKDVVDYDELWDLCHTILVRVNEIQISEILNQTLTVTIGIARYPENADNCEGLLSCVEKALYRGKTKGRNCFIIYLPEKHANIVPKDEKQRALGSMSLHSNIFRFLTSSDNLRMGIINLFNFISSYFEVDHLCIQTEKRIYLQKINPLSKNKDFKYISHELIRDNMNRLAEVLYVNDTKNLLRAGNDELYQVFMEQHITSTCFCEISYRNEHYGMLRADMTDSATGKRLWQYSEMDLLLTAAKTMALVLHYSGKTFEKL